MEGRTIQKKRVTVELKNGSIVSVEVRDNIGGGRDSHSKVLSMIQKRRIRKLERTGAKKVEEETAASRRELETQEGGRETRKTGPRRWIRKITGEGFPMGEQL